MTKKEKEHLNKEYRRHFKMFLRFIIFGIILLGAGIWRYFSVAPSVVEHWYYKQPIVADGSFVLISGVLLLIVGIYHLFFWTKTRRQIKENIENELFEEKMKEYKSLKRNGARPKRSQKPFRHVKKFIIVSISIFLLFSCFMQKKTNCIPHIKIDLVAMMDTITAVINGKIEIPEYKNSVIDVFAYSECKDYSTKTDSLGNFKFSHIDAGILYLIRIPKANIDTILFIKTGGSYEAIIDCNTIK